MVLKVACQKVVQFQVGLSFKFLFVETLFLNNIILTTPVNVITTYFNNKFFVKGLKIFSAFVLFYGILNSKIKLQTRKNK